MRKKSKSKQLPIMELDAMRRVAEFFLILNRWDHHADHLKDNAKGAEKDAELINRGQIFKKM